MPRLGILMNRRAAGCLFSDGKLTLSGYHPKNKFIDGIGGKCLEGETAHRAAIRETMEELFEFEKYPACILEELINLLPPRKCIRTGFYTNFIYSFYDLELMLLHLKYREMESPLYADFPETLQDLLLKRDVKQKTEITHLLLLPAIPLIRIHPLFLKDLSSS
jgi:hypothetical protein